MNREIKFRAVVIDQEGETSLRYDVWPTSNNYVFVDNGGFWMPYKRVEQFTGLKDRNGKDIYEGDICRVLYTDWGSKSDNDPRSIAQYIHDISKVCIVEFIDYEWAFNFGPNRYGEIGYGSFHVGAHGYVELVGNRFENPELIDFNITE